jgi:hypothetical protein
MLPSGTVPHNNLPPEQRLSWIVELLPYLEEDELYNSIDQKSGWDNPPNQQAVLKGIKILRCPGMETEKLLSPPFFKNSFIGVAGLGPDAAALAWCLRA